MADFGLVKVVRMIGVVFKITANVDAMKSSGINSRKLSKYNKVN